MILFVSPPLRQSRPHAPRLRRMNRGARLRNPPGCNPQDCVALYCQQPTSTSLLHKHAVFFLGLFRFFDHTRQKAPALATMTAVNAGGGGMGFGCCGGAMLGPEKNTPKANKPDGVRGFSTSAIFLAASGSLRSERPPIVLWLLEWPEVGHFARPVHAARKGIPNRSLPAGEEGKQSCELRLSEVLSQPKVR